MSSNYCRIYEKHFGIRPYDASGRIYDIHHKDGNRENNDPNNLIALSIQDHYDIHYSQGDYGACLAIGRRMLLSPNELSKLATENNRKRVANGTHPFIQEEFKKIAKAESSRRAKQRVEEGTHHFLGGKISRDITQKRLKDGTHNFIGGEIQRKRVAEGTHHFCGERGSALSTKTNLDMLSKGIHPSQIKIGCPYCNVVGSVNNMKRWHFDKCKNKK